MNRGEAIIAAGTLRHLVTIEQNAQTQNPATGEIVTGWNTYATTYAGIYPMSGREYMAAQQVQGQQIVQIMVRFIPGVTPDMRVNWNGTYYNIQAVLDVESRERVLNLMCHAGTNAG